MKLKLLLLTGFLYLGTGAAVWASDDHTVAFWLESLDKAIDHSKQYSAIREARILRLKEQLKATDTLSLGFYSLKNELYKEYKAYTCDSAIHYLSCNLQWAERHGKERLAIETGIRIAYSLTSAGMYEEASERLKRINRSKLPEELLSEYYDCYCHFYGELGAYTQDYASKDRYFALSRCYDDSLMQVLSPTSRAYLERKEMQKMAAGSLKEALAVNDKLLVGVNINSPEYALATYHRSQIFRDMGNKEAEMRYLTLSSLTDVQLAITDHASLWNLAQLLYERGDIERAYHYMRFSWDQTKFFNARLRSWQSAGILSLIDKTYQAMIERQNKRLEQYAFAITVLVILLLGALIYIYLQMKRLSVARNNLQEANGRLYKLNEELSQMNGRLQSMNMELSEANQIKEEYIARFVKLCSTYIDRLDAYRRMVNKKLSVGQIADLLKITRSHEALDGELEELYMNFDSAFLHIFPDFVNKFNALLQEDARIVLKREELLNTELRIFALIRLGIEDSSQIAEFLRYSVNTIYNYRSKVKNKAMVLRDDFEDLVKAIH